MPENGLSSDLSSRYPLSRYPLGSFREVLSLSFPIILTLISSSFMGFCDRLFLAHESLESLEGCVDAAALCYLFQISLMFAARATQVFVGQCLGLQKYREIGGYVWQMVWISILSMVIIIPLERIVEKFFFQDTTIELAGSTYSRCLIWFTFLYPMGTVLSSFYIGRGNVRFILLATLVANTLNLVLDPLFIFGVPGLCPHMGVFGAALSTGISQGIFCLILFIDFLRRKNREMFGTHIYKINKQTFLESLKLGFPKSISKAVVTGVWVANIHLMTVKGGDYLIALSIGNSIGLLFLFLNEGMWQGILTIASYAMGKNDNQAVNRVLRSGLLCLLVFTIIVAFPCVIFPKLMLSIFFPEVMDNGQIIYLVNTCRWFWFFFIFHGMSGIPFFCLVAKKDIVFTMYYNIFFTWLFQYIPLSIVMNKWSWTPDKFYLILGLGQLISASTYFLRLRLKSKSAEISSLEDQILYQEVGITQDTPILNQTLQDR